VQVEDDGVRCSEVGDDNKIGRSEVVKLYSPDRLYRVGKSSVQNTADRLSLDPRDMHVQAKHLPKHLAWIFLFLGL
jgi:hypothetical protein